MEKAKVLAKYLGCNVEDLEQQSYNDNVFEYGNEEYLVLTDEEADDNTKDYILSSIWAFNPDFIAEHTKNGYDVDLVESIKEIQEQCEGANSAILAMIEDEADFVADAISSDGRGHFLSGYDGKEQEQEGYFIYRVN